jgi:hypothetical protein
MAFAHRCCAFVSLFAVASFSPVALAASQRTFVHSPPFGADANTASNCSLTAPCRSFNAAISVTLPGGEVVILDTAGYGSMTIDKSITVIGPTGVYGGITVNTPGGAGITINAGDADVVKLRGLDIASSGAGGRYGINVVNAKAVHIEKTTISSFSDPAGACLYIDVAKGMRVFVNDSFLRDCEVGAHVNGSSTNSRPRLVLENTRIERGTGVNTDIGVIATNNVDLSMRNCVVTSLGFGLRFENTLNGVQPVATLFNTSLHGINSPIIAGNAGDATSQMSLEITNSEIVNASTPAIDVSATNTGSTLVYLTETRVSRYPIGIRTNGTGGSWAEVFLLRSQLEHGTTAVEHHFGRVVLNASQVVWHLNSLVNAGSNDIKSLNNNLIYENNDSTGGVTYITPATVPVK